MLRGFLDQWRKGCNKIQCLCLSNIDFQSGNEVDVFNKVMMNPWSGCLRDAASSLLLKSNISSSDRFSKGGIPAQLEVPELGKGLPGEFLHPQVSGRSD